VGWASRCIEKCQWLGSQCPRRRLARNRPAPDSRLAQPLRGKIALAISHFVNVPPLVAQSDLVATIARPIATQQSRFHPITLLEPPFAIPLIQIKQVWHRRFDNSPKLVWLRRLIADMSQNKPRM
jgi:DNA-binding transcriptional LysR family regulator